MQSVSGTRTNSPTRLSPRSQVQSAEYSPSSFGWIPPIRYIPITEDPIGNLKQFALPAFAVAIQLMAIIMRMTRTTMLEVLSQDYVRTARAKGVPWKAVVWRHALRNALIPIITVVGLYLGILIGNSVLTEIVFSRPGLGKLLIGALNQRDYPMLQGMMVIYTLIVVLVNLLTDLAYGVVDPRVKLK